MRGKTGSESQSWRFRVDVPSRLVSTQAPELSSPILDLLLELFVLRVGEIEIGSRPFRELAQHLDEDLPVEARVPFRGQRAEPL